VEEADGTVAELLVELQTLAVGVAVVLTAQPHIQQAVQALLLFLTLALSAVQAATLQLLVVIPSTHFYQAALTRLNSGEYSWAISQK
jgi:hypothetical protein